MFVAPEVRNEWHSELKSKDENEEEIIPDIRLDEEERKEIDRKNEWKEKNVMNLHFAEDIWSLGVILYHLMTGQPENVKEIGKLDFMEEEWLTCEDSCKDFI